MTAQEAVDKGHDIARETNSHSRVYTAIVIEKARLSATPGELNHKYGAPHWEIEFERREHRYGLDGQRATFHTWEFRAIKKFPH